MSFPRYPAYRASGVEWLGDVPEHWSVRPLKYVVQMRSGGTPSKERVEYWNGSIPWASSKDLKVEQLHDTVDHLTELAIAAGAAETIPSGASLVVVRGMILAHSFPVARTTQPMAINQDLKAILPREALTSEFLPWLLRGSARESLSRLDEAAHGTKALRMEAWASMDVPTPPRDEQAVIAAFLERETAKIDVLVAEQRRLIELLKEKRQAVISHAVTKGLNPDVPMKPSGVQWFDEVPAHWEIGPLKRTWRVTDCKHVTAEFTDDGFPLASIREVQNKWVDLENAKRTTQRFYELLIEGERKPSAGDLIFSRNATVGEVAQVHDSHPLFAMGQDVVLLRKIHQNESSDYLQAVLRSPLVLRQLDNMMIGSTFKRINVDDIRSIVVPIPTPAEQQRIASYVQSKIDHYDKLADEAERAIAILNERRTSLVSAAVTGQIDLRDLTADAA